MPESLAALLPDFPCPDSTIRNKKCHYIIQSSIVRHQDKRYPGRPTAYQLWRANDGRFEEYQSYQGGLIFSKARMLATFVATPLNETLFVGLYAIGEVGKVPKGTRDPLSDHDISGLYLYQLTLSKNLKEYRGRLIVE